MNVDFHAPRRVGSGELPNDALPGKKKITPAPPAAGSFHRPTPCHPSQKGLTPFFKKSPASERERAERGTSEASERELAFVPPLGAG